jgi:carboxyl-terminal processing protease
VRDALRSLRAFVVVGLALFAGLFLGLATVVSASAKGRDQYAGLESFARALATIQQSYVDDTDTPDLVRHAIAGLVSGLDAHSVWLDAAEYGEMMDRTEGEGVGVGLVLTVPATEGDEGLLVSRVIAGSPGELAGVRAGDLLTAVDGNPVVDLETASAALAGERGTRVRLGLIRGLAPLELHAVRDRVIDPGVAVEAIEEGFVYVRIEHFRRNVASEIDRRLGELEARRPLRGVILDVRDNPGGLLEEAVALVDLFAEDGEIVSTRGRDGALVERHDATASPRDRDAKLVVLTNERSASASEIVAGALQASHRATIVGTRTYGKGSVQQVFPIEDGSALKLTVARYALAGGTTIDDVGVTPDREVVFVAAPATAAIRADVAALAIDGTARDRLLADVAALETTLPVSGPPPVPWTGSFAERRQQDPQLEAAWAAIAP